jgi:hypothetical protein
MEKIDRAAIFLNLCHRNRIRREASLPLLDLQTEYSLAIAIAQAARLRVIRQQYVPEGTAGQVALPWAHLWTSAFLNGTGFDPYPMPREHHRRLVRLHPPGPEEK